MIFDLFYLKKMEKIKEEFAKNDMLYKLLERTDDWGLFEMRTRSGGGPCYEIAKIYKNKPNEFLNREYWKESITPNSRFGLDGSKTYIRKDLADKYYAKVTGV